MDQLIVVGFYAVLAILVITAGKTLFTKKELSHFRYVSSLVLFCSLLYLVLGQVISYILPFVYSTPFDEADGMFDEAFNIFPNICFVLGVFASVTYSLLSVKSKNTNKFFLFLPLLLLVISWLLMLSTIKDESSTTMELVSTGSFFRTMFILNDVATYPHSTHSEWTSASAREKEPTNRPSPGTSASIKSTRSARAQTSGAAGPVSAD